MPCDEPWPDEQVQHFRAWIDRDAALAEEVRAGDDHAIDDRALVAG
jgi:hypothetical protein